MYRSIASEWRKIMNTVYDLEKLIIGNKPVICENCQGKMFYVSSGKYECRLCGHIVLDDFGKVKQYLEDYGPSPAIVVSEATGVPTEIIEMFLKRGRIEIPEGSKYYLKCERCSCSIRYGRFCPDCVRELANGIKVLFNEDVGAKPKYEVNPNMAGKMHYFNTRTRY